MEYHIITRLIQGIIEYQIVRTLKGENPLYGYSGYWEKYKRGPPWEIKIFDSYGEAYSYLDQNIAVTDRIVSYLDQNIAVTDRIVAPQVEPATVSILFGILEELKTTNDILASSLGELKEFLHPETPQPTQEYNLIVEQLPQEKIVFYVLGRTIDGEAEYKIVDYSQSNIRSYGDWHEDWQTISEAFGTYVEAVNFMDTRSK